MSGQQSQQTAQATTTSEPPKWGELPLPERIADVKARRAEWDSLPVEARGDPAKGEGRSAFDREGPHGWQGQLTGADVFYLAARVLAGSAELGAIEAAALRLVGIRRAASAVHLEGFESTNLIVGDGGLVSILGDERTARERKDGAGKRKSREWRL
jgi:hypothetical protein